MTAGAEASLKGLIIQSLKAIRIIESAVTFYLDESATDGGTPDAVVAGVLLNESHFDALDKRWKKLVADHHLGTSLHMKDFGKHGKHANLSEPEREAIFSDVVPIINTCKIYSIAATLTVAEYNSHFNPELKEEMGLYGIWTTE